MGKETSVLSWVHIGDLHITQREEPNFLHLQRIVELVNGLPVGSIDFVVLPGDNADDGTEEQFRLVQEGVAPLDVPLHILSGDHDYKSRSLDGFYRTLGGHKLPYGVTCKGHRCLFLDVVSAGEGGPDFRLDARQAAWVQQQLRNDKPTVVFMHTYPADLKQGAGELGALLADPRVRCVDMGHTHYNELANDGGTIYMATRSTGQTEEGPPGLSVAAIDGHCVSWRFKHLDELWPLVLITSPADRRLVTSTDQIAAEGSVVRAKVLGNAPIAAVEMQVGAGAWRPMAPVAGETALWQLVVDAVGGTIRVRARDRSGRTDTDVIEPAGRDWTPPRRAGDGSDRDRVGAWPEKFILDTQLGPNRNGQQW